MKKIMVLLQVQEQGCNAEPQRKCNVKPKVEPTTNRETTFE